MPPKKPATTESTPPLRRSPRKRMSPATELEAEGSQTKRVKPSAEATEIMPNPSGSFAGTAQPDRATGVFGAAAAALSHRIPSPNFSGNFDIYNMNIPACLGAYPGLNGGLNFELLYQKILESQQRNKYSGQVYLAPPQQDSEVVQLSQLKHSTLCGLDGASYSILLRDIEHHDQITMPPMGFTFHDPDISGISAHLSLLDENGLVAGSIGTLHFRRVWRKIKDNGEIGELFAGHLSLKTIFYGHKGQGSGQNWTFSIWAVRARIGGNGREIGLMENIPGIPITVTSQEPAKHPNARINPLPLVLPETEHAEDHFSSEGEEEFNESEVELLMAETIAAAISGVAATMNFLMPSLLQQSKRFVPFIVKRSRPRKVGRWK